MRQIEMRDDEAFKQSHEGLSPEEWYFHQVFCREVNADTFYTPVPGPEPGKPFKPLQHWREATPQQIEDVRRAMEGGKILPAWMLFQVGWELAREYAATKDE